jgi:predicted patatin/cPLA2 family phospholipase
VTAAAADNRHQILALTGGGYRGVFTAAFLARCEA